MLGFFMGVFGIMTALLVFCIIRGPSVWDRLLGYNLFSVAIILWMIVYALYHNLYYLLDIAIVYALLGFIGTVFFARFIQRRGKI